MFRVLTPFDRMVALLALGMALSLAALALQLLA